MSEQGVRFECLSGTPIPLYRLVYFQVDREARHRPDLPAQADLTVTYDGTDANGHTEHFHAMVSAALVAPGHERALPLEPEFIAPQDGVHGKIVSNIEEVKARGGKVIAIVTEGDEEIARLADAVFHIPATHDLLTPILASVPLQLFAYYVAVRRGCHIDQPRNLAKSVTVE